MRHYNVDRFLLLVLQSSAGIIVAFILELAGAAASSITGSTIPSLGVSLALLGAAVSLWRAFGQYGWLIGTLLGACLAAWTVWYLKSLHLVMGIPL